MPPVDKKWIRTRSDEVAIKEGCYFDQSAADRICYFFETFLCHSKGKWAGKPFLLEEWERDFLGQIHGWRRPNKTRRFREIYLEIAKKNGKSAFSSGHTIASVLEEPGAEVYLGAVDRKQASIVFNESAAMVRASPYLRDRLTILKSQKRIVYEATNSFIVAMSADAPSQDGVSSNLVILDELHRHKNSNLYDVMRFSGIARDQPLFMTLTTAGADKHSLCYKLHQKALEIIEGTRVDTEFLGVVYGCDPKKDDLEDPKSWKKANPSLGSILSEEDFRKQFEQAKQTPTDYRNFLRLRLNVWLDHQDEWLSVEKWDGLASEIDLEALKGLPLYIGIDLSSNQDLTAVALLWVHPDGTYTVKVLFFVPEENAAKRAAKDKVPYLDWIDEGDIFPIPGEYIDQTVVLEAIRNITQGHDVKTIGVDTWHSGPFLVDLIQEGYDAHDVRPNFGNFNGPTRELELRMSKGTIRHDGNPCMSWNIGNARPDYDHAGYVRPSKKKNIEKCDGVYALVIAFGEAMNDQPEPETRVMVFDFDKR